MQWNHPMPNQMLQISDEQARQFLQTVANLDDTKLQMFIQQARARGISDHAIQAGINMIQGLKHR